MPRVIAALFVLASPALARAATINITTADDYTKIEAAKPGDEVVIAPGTYKFLVYLTQQAPANNPIIIRAQDPANPPVWDLGGAMLETAKGSYTASDRGRGCWQLSGATNITIESIVFTNCRNTAQNAAGIRYYNTTTGLVVRDCLFKTNDNGLTGGTQASEAIVEYSEFDSNGNTQASAATHNIYNYGGTFTLRYSYIHDSVQAENLHIRAAQSTIESNWIARAANYEADLMTSDDFTGSGPYSQSMIFRGNVVVEGTPANHGQIIAVFNDTGTANLTMHVEVLNNTVVAAAAQGALVHLSNADHTKMSAVITNNILTVSTTAFSIADPTNGTVTGSDNWFLTGTAVAPLTGSIFGTDPMFQTAPKYRLASGSACIGAAAAATNLPVTEYYLDETMKRMYRVRNSVKDLGAFELATTGPGIGPYSTQPVLDAGPTGGEDSCCFGEGGAVGDSGEDGGGGGNGGGGGCGCDVPGAPISPFGGSAIVLALGLACRRRARRDS